MPIKSDWGLKEPYQAFTFADLGYVRDYQIGQLQARGVANPSLAPQAMLAATEQGWSTGTDALDGMHWSTSVPLAAPLHMLACHARMTSRSHI